MSLRSILPLIITLAVLALCADLAIEAHRMEAHAQQLADSGAALAAKIDGRVSAVAQKIDTTIEHVDAAVGNIVNPLPAALPAVPSSLSSLFSKPTPSPKKP